MTDIRGLYNIIVGYVRTEVVDGKSVLVLVLPAEAIDSEPIESLYAEFMNGGPLELLLAAEPKLDLAQNIVTIAGARGRSFPLAETDVDVVWTILAGVPQMELTAFLPEGPGGLVKPFPELAGTAFDTLAFSDTTVLTLASYDVAPSLPRGLALRGALLLVGDLLTIRVLFNSDRVPLQAPMSLTSDIPVFAALGEITGEVVVGSFGLLSMSFLLKNAAVEQDGELRAVATVAVLSAIHYTSAGQPQSLTIQTYGFAPEDILFQGDIGEALQLGLAAVSQLADGANVQGLLPAELPVPAVVQFGTWVMTLNPGDASLRTLTAGLALNVGWEIVPDVIALERVDFTFTYSLFTPSPLSMTASAIAAIGEGDEPGLVRITASYPGFRFDGGLLPGTRIDLYTLALRYIGQGAADIIPRTLAVTQLNFSVDPANVNFSIAAAVTVGWELTVGPVTISLQLVRMALDRTAGRTSGLISAVFQVVPDDPFTLFMTAGYDGAAAGWYFKSGLEDGQIPLGSLIQIYAPVFASFPLSGLVVRALEARFQSGSNQSYGFTVAVDWEISPQILSFEAAMELDSKPVAGLTTYTGYVSGAIEFFGVRMAAKADMSVTPPIYTFEFWGVTAVLRNNVVQFTLPDRSLGQVIELLVEAAFPGAGLKLPPPFNVLNAIRLNNFGFEFNFDTSVAKVTYPRSGDLGLDFGFLAIDQFALTYSGDTRLVELSISKGRFLDETIKPGDPPKTFDVTDPSSMANQVPGQGDKLFKLEFLGLGQHVAPKTPIPQGATIAYAVDSLAAAFKKSTTSPPPAAPITPISATQLQFDDGANWIVALDAKILSTVTIKALFLDPEMYGVSIGVFGPKGGKFNGLGFDILYRRVNENVGVYQIELKLPDVMRTLQFGAVTLTLPIIKLEIFTNGDFRVDFGFPAGGDFSRSFGVQVLPFVGAGGFYFGLLSSASSTRVPATPYGQFSPVLELGLGLRVGLGKEVNAGILSAGLSVTLQGIVEGVIAWYSPYQLASGGDDAFFYAVRGKFQLVGNMYGEVNFAIISARLDITVKLGVTLFVQIYEPVQFGMFVSVRVTLRVRINLGIFKITINLSFTARIEASFTIGRKSRAPWDSALGTPRTPARLAGATALGEDEDECPADARPELVWQPILLDGAPRREVELLAVAQFTAASAIVDGLAQAARPRAVTTLVARTQPEGSETLAPFVELAQGVFLWALAAWLFRAQDGVTLQQVLDAEVSADDLQATYCQLLLTPDGNVEPFTGAELDEFVTGFFHFTLRPAVEGALERLVSAVPMVPALSMAAPRLPPVDFATFNETSTQVLADIKTYFRELEMRAEKAAAGDARTWRLRQAETTLSMATFLWMDFFALIARESVQKAIDALREVSVPAGGGESLRELARRHARFSRSAEDIARANLTRRLRAGARVALPGAAVHQVGARERASLHQVARRHGFDPLALALHNLDTRDLFAPGKLLIPNVESTTVADLLPLMAWNDLSGLAARVLLAGLRPPYPAAGGGTELMALYEISGQQWDASGLQAGDQLSLAVDLDEAGEWISVTGPIVFSQTEADIAAAFDGIVLEPAYAEPPEAQPLYRTEPKRFSLANPIRWTTADVSSLWIFPDDLQVLITGEHALRPKVTIVEEVQDAAHRPPSIAAQGDEIAHTWATAVPLVVRRIPSALDTSLPLPTTYDLRGTTQSGGVLLQALLSWWEQNGRPAELVAAIEFLYPPDPAQPAPPAGLVSVPEAEFFLVQTNLSTVSNPATAAAQGRRGSALEEPQGPLAMTPIEFLRKVWECSLVRSGGYDFFYRAGGAGLPAFLFEQQTDVTLTMLVTYTISDDVLQSFLNAVVLRQPADPDANTYIMPVPQAVPAAMLERGVSLEQLARRHHATVAEIAAQNRATPLRHGAHVRLGAHAGARTHTVGAGGAIETLQSLARTHGTSVAALAVANRATRHLFAQTPQVEDQLVDRVIQIPPGNSAWQMVRRAPQAPQLSLGAALDEQTPQQGLQELYNLAGFAIADNASFRPSDWALPAGPAIDDVPSADPGDDRAARVQADLDAGLWPYRAALPIARFAKDPGTAPAGVSGGPDPESSPYRGVGGSLRLELAYLDTFGNRVRTGSGAPETLDLPVDYFDDLLPAEEWAGSGFDYVIEGDGVAPATLTLTINFDTSPYLQPAEGGPNPVEMAASVATRYARAFYQLAPDHVRVALDATCDSAEQEDTPGARTALLSYLARCYDFLKAVELGGEPVVPAPARITRGVACDNPEDLFELVVGLTLERTCCIDPALDDPVFAAVRTVTSVVQPNYEPQAAPEGSDDPGAPLTLRAFAQRLEAAFPGMKVLAGTPETGSDGQPRPRETWLMRFSEQGGVSYTIAAAAPRFYALAPVARAPRSGEAEIYDYVRGRFIGDSTPALQTFSGVDLEVLAQEFLGAVDQFLSPDYVVPAWQAINTPAPAARPNPVDDVLAAKQVLAGKLAATLVPVLASQLDPPADALAQAIESVRQALLIRLSDAYALDTLLQYGVSVESDFSGVKAPALYGKPILSGLAPAEQANYSLSTTRFSLATDGVPYLTFAFSTRSARAASVVDLPLRLALGNVEQPGEPVPGIADYRPSSWLSFVIPFDQEPRDDLGTPAIPVPLRAYPTPPSMAAQKGAPVDAAGAGESDLDRAKRWIYDFAYDYPPADQDAVYATVEFSSPTASSRAAAAGLDLFTALVQFSTQYRKILSDLNETLLVPGGDLEVARAAIASLAWLVGRAAQAWDNRGPSASTLRAAGATSLRSARIKESATTYGGVPGALLLEVEPLAGAPPSPRIAGYDTVAVPAEAGYVFVDPQRGTPLTRAQAQALPRRTLAYDGLTILVEESALATTYVRRNEVFGAQPANEAFIYQTPEVRFFTPLTPELDPCITIDVADYTTPPAGLATYLKNFLAELFKGAPPASVHTLRIAGSFSAPLQPVPVESGEGFPISLPIFLTGPVTVASAPALDALGERIAAFVLAWFDDKGLRGKTGRLWFDVSLYSGATLAQLPTLRLRAVYLDSALIWS